MLPRRLESLGERLLRAGIAPRHVRRYLSELGDHFDDALRSELAKGIDLAAARQAAWARLGTEESLAQSMLERPELRSTAARFPKLAFGAGPVLTWLAAPAAIAAALSLLPEGARPAPPSDTFVTTVYALCLVHARLVPVLLGAVALEAAARRRSSVRWALVGATAVDVLAGSLTLYASSGQLGVSSSLVPWLLPLSGIFGPRDLAALGAGLLRAAGMLAASWLLHRLARRHEMPAGPMSAG